MTQRWFLAKYVRDLRRREPRNVGVILFCNGSAHFRFFAEDPGVAEKIDGRTIRYQVGSQANYRAWVHYWRSVAEKKPLEELLRRAPDDNYYLEEGGRVLAGPEAAPDQFIDQLYAELVDDTSLHAGEDGQPHPAGPLDEFLAAPGERVRVERNVLVDLGGDDKAPFEYVLAATRRVAIRVVTLNGQPSKTWDALHAAAHAVKAAAAVNAGTDPFAVLLEKDPGPDKDRQIRVLEAQIGSSRLRRASAEDMRGLRQYAAGKKIPAAE
jgi:hypothetical protein